MTARRGGAVALAALSLVWTLGVLAGCGGGQDAAEGSSPQAAAVAAGSAYATRVAALTQQTSARLAQLAASSNYETAKAAQSSTQAYAASIRAAADGLAKASPPRVVAPQHRALVALYRATADRMDALAAKFATASSLGALSQQAQAFSAEVARYSSRESQLRAAIQQALAAQAAPPVAPTTVPGIQGTSDPG